MTFNNEIEELKAQIKVLETKLSFLEEIEKQPRMNLQQEGEYAVVSYHDKTYYRLENKTTFSWYIKKDVSEYHIHYRSPNLIMVNDAETERLLEGIYYNHIQVKKEKEQRTKTPVEECYKDWWGQYPETGTWDSFDEKRWQGFQAGYEFAYEEKVVEEPEETEQSLKEAFREAVKQGIVSSVDEPTKPMNEVLDRLENKYENDDVVNRMLKKWEENPPDFLKFELGRSLEALITRWWDDVYDGIHQDWDREVAIDDLIDQIQLWLPKSQSSSGTQSASVIDLVDGYNDALTKIKSKLRNKK